MSHEIIMGVIGVAIYLVVLYYGIKMVESIKRDQETALRCLFLRDEARNAFKALYIGGFTFTIGYGLSIISRIVLDNNTYVFEIIIGVTAIIAATIVLYAFKNLYLATSSPERYKEMES